MTEKPDLTRAYDLKTPDDSRALYRAWAETYDADFVEAHGFRMPGRIAQIYLERGGGWPCLDVGCGTGAIGRHMPEAAVLDGLDISPEMLAVAGRSGRYRTLFEADLTQPLKLPEAHWLGLVSSGTFTTGHVGPGALAELMSFLAPAAFVAVTVKSDFFDGAGFAAVLDKLEERGEITDRELRSEPIYEPGLAPEGHEGDTGLILTFSRC